MDNTLDLIFLDPMQKLIVLTIRTNFKSNTVELGGWQRKKVARVLINNHLYLLSDEDKGQIIYDGDTRMPFWTLSRKEINDMAKLSLPEAVRNPNEHVLYRNVFSRIWKILEERGLNQDKIDKTLQSNLKQIEEKYGKRPND